LRTIAFIFARGGSKGVPGKNIKSLGGKPLIAYSIEIALACPGIESVIVSTDDAEIAKVACQYGAEVPFRRPAELATDTASEWQAWQHAIEWVRQNRGEFDLFVSLPATAPFRSVSDVQNCIAVLRDDAQADIAIAVKEAERSPFFNMVYLDDDGFARLLIPPADAITRRQDAPLVYDITTVAYVTRPEFVLNSTGLFEGRVKAIAVPAERSLDIDTPYDFMLAEAIVNFGLYKNNGVS